MSNIETYGELFPLEKTLCNSCKYRLSRAFIPLNLDNLDIDEDALKELEEVGDIAVEEHTCLIIGEDMDYLVVSCNKFEPNNDITIFKHDFDTAP